MHRILVEIREWVAFIVEWAILIVIIMEYQYDKSKDEAKKHKSTKTTKKTTTKPGGETITEEATETHEPITKENTEDRIMRREAPPK